MATNFALLLGYSSPYNKKTSSYWQYLTANQEVICSHIKIISVTKKTSCYAKILLGKQKVNLVKKISFVTFKTDFGSIGCDGDFCLLTSELLR